jgi:hypothetical protein
VAIISNRVMCNTVYGEEVSMEDGLKLSCPDGASISGGIQITDSELIFFKKTGDTSKPLVFFETAGGLLYNALIPCEEAFRIRMDDIKEVKRERRGFKKDVCDIILKTGETYVAFFVHPRDTTDFLERAMIRAAQG